MLTDLSRFKRILLLIGKFVKDNSLLIKITLIVVMEPTADTKIIYKMKT
jgi:hypothetical protein